MFWNRKINRAHQKWHTWFAWYPVRLETSDPRPVYVWLETVRRKGVIYLKDGREIMRYYHYEHV